MPLFDKRSVDTAGDTAVHNATIRSGYDPLNWYVECSWGEGHDLIIATIRYGKNHHEPGQQMVFEFRTDTIIDSLIAEMKKYYSEYELEVMNINIIRDKDVYLKSPYALINDVRGFSFIRDSIKRHIQSKLICSQNERTDVSFTIFEEFEKTMLKSVALLEAFIWLMNKPKYGWADFVRNYVPRLTS